MAEKQKNIIKFLNEIYYEENDRKKGNLITQVKAAQKELKDQKDLANLTDEEWSDFLESARLLREESTDSIGMLISLGALTVSVLAAFISEISVVAGMQTMVSAFAILAAFVFAIFAVVMMIYTYCSVTKSARRADRYRSIILALLLLKDDETLNEVNEMKSVEPKQNESK